MRSLQAVRGSNWSSRRVHEVFAGRQREQLEQQEGA
jgi:hypothetical protein